MILAEILRLLQSLRHDNKSNPQDKITLQRKLVCHSKHCEESLPESLVAKRDSSPLAGV
ncbi:hypothetical protein [Helicobacter marmotae]|uniref:hypothetical protein n=1 Tax=Helicobacter marmotae TaxID=152490 RepID=UPI001315865A|nr:hypothetical protein [Helicobacter marmotae]